LGQLTLDDLKLAKATASTLVAFNTKIPREMTEQIRLWKLQLLEGMVIYELEEKLEMLLEKGVEAGEVVGQLKVLAVFRQVKDKQTVGGEILQGKLAVGQRLKIIREEVEQGEGKIVSLEQNKQPVSEVSTGLCGLVIRSASIIKPGDLLVGQ
jgi:translation initiation factor IF-2